MGRKRRTYEVDRVTVVIPKLIKEQLKEAGVNNTQLFLQAAEKELNKFTKK